MSPRKSARPKYSLLNPSPQAARLALVVLLLLGFGLRMLDLTDAPLDFHPTRQMHGAIVARSIYYEMQPHPDPFVQEQMVSIRGVVGEFEPPILETLIAAGYMLVGGPQLWVARVINSLVWVLAAIPLYDLARRISGRGAALLATAYYLFLPFGAQASRSFQPDPFMTAWLVLALYAAWRWSERQEWKWAWLAGAAAGFAVLIKIVAAYLVIGFMVALVLSTLGWRAALRNRQVWAMALASSLPAAWYYLFGISGTSGTYLQNWILTLLPQTLTPAFYIFWVKMLSSLFSSGALLAAGVGVLLAPPKARGMLAGIWLGYVAYGLSLPHQTTTHSYYHLQMVPMLALSLTPVLEALRERLAGQARLWQAVGLLVALGTLLHAGWITRSAFFGVDYRDQPAFWERIGSVVPRDGDTIALVEGYGYLLNYYGGRNLRLWPIAAELDLAALRGNELGDFEDFFLDRTANLQYFLITAFGELDKQPELAKYLETNFAVYERGSGYVIYDLRTD